MVHDLFILRKEKRQNLKNIQSSERLETEHEIILAIEEADTSFRLLYIQVEAVEMGEPSQLHLTMTINHHQSFYLVKSKQHLLCIDPVIWRKIHPEWQQKNQQRNNNCKAVLKKVKRILIYIFWRSYFSVNPMRNKPMGRTKLLLKATSWKGCLMVAFYIGLIQNKILLSGYKRPIWS